MATSSAATACVAVPTGARVLVVSDLFLSPTRTEASASATGELALALRRAEGPGAFIVAGNAFDLLAAGERIRRERSRPTASCATP